VICDGSPDAKALIPAIRALDMKVDVATSNEHAQACAMLVDGVNDGTFRHLGTPELSAALKGAATRPMGDSWAWARKTSNVGHLPAGRGHVGARAGQAALFDGGADGHMGLNRLAALTLTVLAGLLVVAGVAFIYWPAALITAGVLLLAGLFGPNVE
jgi:hypothetical protein